MRHIFRQAFLLAVALFLSSTSANEGGAPHDLEVQVSRSRPWLRLLHFESRWYGGGQRSLLDGDGFFFAPNGSKDPLAELRASITAFGENRQVGIFKIHPQCAFPERYRFLKEKFGERVPAPVPCPKYQEFLDRFNDPQGVSLIFSSAFPNNPASMFGHTFLRIHSKRRTDLLDYGMNFAAAVSEDDASGLKFMVFGLFGGYRGQWSTMPYYVKVNEYVNAESRDLWEYELEFTPEESRRLLAHLWEMETNSYFAYYFLDENCSYQILAALEAVKPDWNLKNFWLGVLPGETVKQVAYTPGAVRHVRYRPSLQHQFFNVYGTLDSREREEFMELVERKRPLNTFKSRPVIDATINYLDYLSHEHKSVYKSKYENYRREILEYRATLGPSTDAEIQRIPALDGQTRPEIGHDAYNVRLGAGYRDARASEGFTSLQIQLPYHDLLNNDRGYTRYAHFQFPIIDLQSRWKKPGLEVERLSVLSATSLMVYRPLDQRWSWKVDAGLYRARDYGCSDCRHWFVEVGGGRAIALGHPRNLLYGMVIARPEASSDLPNGYRLLPGVEGGVVLNPLNAYKTRLNLAQFWNALPEKESNRQFLNVKWENALFLRRNWEIRQSSSLNFASSHEHPYAEHRLESIFFFN